MDTPSTAARIHWCDIFDSLRSSLPIGVAICADHLRRQDYPRSLDLVYEGGWQVFFSAAQLCPNAEPIQFNVLVLFKNEASEAPALG